MLSALVHCPSHNIKFRKIFFFFYGGWVGDGGGGGVGRGREVRRIRSSTVIILKSTQKLLSDVNKDFRTIHVF